MPQFNIADHETNRSHTDHRPDPCHGSDQCPITIKEKNIPLQTALKTISQQSSYDFIYSDQVFRDAHPVTLNLGNAPIETALNLCFKGQPLTYKIEDKTVMVRRKDPTDTKTNKSNRWRILWQHCRAEYQEW